MGSGNADQVFIEKTHDQTRFHLGPLIEVFLAEIGNKGDTDITLVDVADACLGSVRMT